MPQEPPCLANAQACTKIVWRTLPVCVLARRGKGEVSSGRRASLFCRPLTPSSFCSFVSLIRAGDQNAPLPAPAQQLYHTNKPLASHNTLPPPPLTLKRQAVASSSSFSLPSFAFRQQPPHLKHHEDVLLHGSPAARRCPGQGRPKPLGNQTSTDQMLPRGERCPAVCFVFDALHPVFVACHVLLRLCV